MTLIYIYLGQNIFKLLGALLEVTTPHGRGSESLEFPVVLSQVRVDIERTVLTRLGDRGVRGNEAIPRGLALDFVRAVGLRVEARKLDRTQSHIFF
jgi:hypothetical protein